MLIFYIDHIHNKVATTSEHPLTDQDVKAQLKRDFDRMLINGEDLNTKDRYDQTLLSKSLESQDRHLVSELLQQGVNPNLEVTIALFTNCREYVQVTPLVIAIMNSDIQSLQLLLKYSNSPVDSQYSVNPFDRNYYLHPLAIAFSHCDPNPQVVEMLMSHSTLKISFIYSIFDNIYLKLRSNKGLECDKINEKIYMDMQSPLGKLFQILEIFLKHLHVNVKGYITYSPLFSSQRKDNALKPLDYFLVKLIENIIFFRKDVPFFNINILLYIWEKIVYSFLLASKTVDLEYIPYLLEEKKDCYFALHKNDINRISQAVMQSFEKAQTFITNTQKFWGFNDKERLITSNWLKLTVDEKFFLCQIMADSKSLFNQKMPSELNALIFSHLSSTPLQRSDYEEILSMLIDRFNQKNTVIDALNTFYSLSY